MAGRIGAIAERVARGEQLNDDDARVVLGTHDLIPVGAMADDVRRRLHGARTTFLRVLEVHVEAPPSALPPGAAAGEIRLVGQPASAEAAAAAVRAAVAVAGRTPVSGFTLPALLEAAGGDVPALEALCVELRNAGLWSVAAVPLDMADPRPAVEAARRAGLAVTRLTVERLPGEDRLERILHARALQAAAGGFRSFAPLPRTIDPAAPTTGYDDVKAVAVARLLLADIPSIQVDWPLYGPKLAQVVLTTGADDVDGVAAVEAGTLGRRRTALEEIRGNIRAAALEPVERDARWEPVEA